MSVRQWCPVRVNPVLAHPQELRAKLDGEWLFRLDPGERGLKEHWFEDEGALTEPIQVPGCWQGQGFGGDGKDTIWDFRLEARVFRATYQGTGWYGKRFHVPADWDGKRLCLNFGGVHPSAEVWLNGVRLGENHEPFAPFGFEITETARPGQGNWLVARVHEQARPLGFSFNWQGNWSGLYRGVELTASEPTFLQQARLHPDVDRQALFCHVELGGAAPASGTLLRVSLQDLGCGSPTLRREFEVTEPTLDLEIAVPSPRLWSPDSPNLHRVDLELLGGAGVLDALSERVGFVKLSTEGNRFLINGEPYYMRGTGDFMAHPETGCPDTDRERWRRKLRALRDYGYNYVRCQSYVPSPEYFDVADEVGLLVQSEMGALGAWGGQSQWHIYAWPPPFPAWRGALRQQWNDVVLRDVNHPSANIYCMSNELRSTDFPKTAWQCHDETKVLKPTAFVIWTDGGHSNTLPQDFVNAEAGVSGQCDKPVIQHEFRWWSSFPDVRASHKYSGALRPYSAEIALEAARRQGLAHLLPEFADRSQRLQFVDAKAKMEICRRDNPKLAGICHFNAMDANPSPQGIIDEFYERKLVDAPTWLQTNGDTALMCSLGFDDRALEAGGEFKCTFSVSDFAHPPMASSVLEWRLRAGGETLAAGSLPYSPQPYCARSVGEIGLTVPAVGRPVAARLEVSLRDAGREAKNAWDLWLFPANTGLPGGMRRYGDMRLQDWNDFPEAAAEELASGGKGVVLTERLDEPLLAFMRGGGRVVLAAGEGLVRPHGVNGCGNNSYFFTPGANYAPYEDGQNGTLVQQHPMFGDFPHEGFADFQFFRLIEGAPPIEIAPLDLSGGEPPLRVIHRYPVCHPLAYLVERGLGAGGIILTSLQLNPAFPEARRLLANIVSYAAGGQFHPELPLSGRATAQIVAATTMRQPEGCFPKSPRFDLPSQWRVFGPVDRGQPPPPKEEMAVLPEMLTLGGRALSPCQVEATGGELDLAPFLGGAAEGKTAYVFIPFETEGESKLRFGFGADWWFAAFLDGDPFLDTLSTGNGAHPVQAVDFMKTATLSAGRHLLSIRFISGGASSRLCVGAWRQDATWG